MTIDKSLRVRRGLVRSRNVLTRAERIAKLADSDRWKEGDPVFGLPKVRVQRVVLKKKKKAKKEEEGAPAAESPPTSARTSGPTGTKSTGTKSTGTKSTGTK